MLQNCEAPILENASISSTRLWYLVAAAHTMGFPSDYKHKKDLFESRKDIGKYTHVTLLREAMARRHLAEHHMKLSMRVFSPESKSVRRFDCEPKSVTPLFGLPLAMGTPVFGLPLGMYTPSYTPSSWYRIQLHEFVRESLLR